MNVNWKLEITYGGILPSFRFMLYRSWQLLCLQYWWWVPLFCPGHWYYLRYLSFIMQDRPEYYNVRENKSTHPQCESSWVFSHCVKCDSPCVNWLMMSSWLCLCFTFTKHSVCSPQTMLDKYRLLFYIENLPSTYSEAHLIFGMICFFIYLFDFCKLPNVRVT